ncbi:MAG: hypothetical protein BGN88_05315 [Clostridiales bacterium 43-6]|nr:MAG: hypothetical protein BGN88_05315 [Clostridiales bacterium 43-6]
MRFIEYEKLSKRKQKEINNKKRTTWELNPVTRKTPTKGYNRKKNRYAEDESFDTGSFLLGQTSPDRPKDGVSFCRRASRPVQ